MMSSAAFFVSSESTLPRKVTTPSCVSTLVSFPGKGRSLQSAVLIFTVNLESATFLLGGGACAEPCETTVTSRVMAAQTLIAIPHRMRARDDEHLAFTAPRGALTGSILPGTVLMRDIWRGRSSLTI